MICPPLPLIAQGTTVRGESARWWDVMASMDAEVRHSTCSEIISGINQPKPRDPPSSSNVRGCHVELFNPAKPARPRMALFAPKEKESSRVAIPERLPQTTILSSTTRLADRCPLFTNAVATSAILISLREALCGGARANRARTCFLLHKGSRQRSPPHLAKPEKNRTKKKTPPLEIRSMEDALRSSRADNLALYGWLPWRAAKWMSEKGASGFLAVVPHHRNRPSERRRKVGGW